jgi:hypothetical protein
MAKTTTDRGNTPHAKAEEARQFFAIRSEKRVRVLACLEAAQESLYLARQKADSALISNAVHACIAAEQQLATLSVLDC